jgi:flagellar hook-associated protein 1
MAQQASLDATNHNLSNVNTPGYSRQTALLAASDPYTTPAFNRSGLPGQVGTGVEVTEIRRMRDAFLDYQIRKEVTDLGRWSIRRDGLEQVETILNEPSTTGLNSILNQYWESWRELSNDPQNTAARATLRQQATNLASTLQRDYAQLNGIKDDMNREISVKVSQINDKATQIADLNNQISRIRAVGDQPNDLEDRRDVLLDDLSKMVKISYNESANGGVTVFLDGKALVEGNSSSAIDVVKVTGGSDKIVWDSDGSDITVAGGELKGYLEARDDLLQKKIDQLQTLTSTIITEVNSRHQAGYGLNGSTGLNFFTGTGANDIDLSAEVKADADNIAAAQAANSPGDGRNAVAIADLASADVTLGAGTTSINEYYKSMVSELGVEITGATNLADNQEVLVQYLQRQKDSNSGVSIDEEAANLIKFQRAYQAAARIVTVCDENLDTIINAMGRVGR